MADRAMPPLEPEEVIIAQGNPSWRSWIAENLWFAVILALTLTVLIFLREGESAVRQLPGAYIGIAIAMALYALFASFGFENQAWIITNRRVLKQDGTSVPLSDIRKIKRSGSSLYLKSDRFRTVVLKYPVDTRATETILKRLIT